MFTFQYKNKLYILTFLEAANLLNEDDRTQLCTDVLDCHYKKKDRQRTVGKSFEGSVEATGKYGLLGEFGGLVYKIKFDCERSPKTQEASIIVGNYQNSKLN